MATITITLNDSDDAALLGRVFAAFDGAPAAATPAPKPAATAKAAPAKAAAPAPKPEPETAPAAEQPATETEAPAAADGPNLQDAISKATELISSGKAAQVKAALGSVGAKRVSELTDKTVGEFLEALDNLA